MTTFKGYLTTLFDPTDICCVCAHVKHNHIFQVDDTDEGDECLQFIVLNPLKPDSVRRRDEDIATFRNFLVECDNLSFEDQRKFVKRLGLPYSVATFSGNKSIHFIISLEEPLKDRQVYAFVTEWIYTVLKQEVDQNCKNPARLTRIPDGTNDKNGNKQELLEVKGRVKNEVLLKWLKEHPECKPHKVQKEHEEIKVLSEKANPNLLSPWTKHLLKEGIYTGKRNSQYFKMGFDFIKAGFTEREAIQYIIECGTLGTFPVSELRTAINSAYQNSPREDSEITYSKGYKSWKR